MNSALARSMADLSSQWRDRFLPWKRLSKSRHLLRAARRGTFSRRYLQCSGGLRLPALFTGTLLNSIGMSVVASAVGRRSCWRRLRRRHWTRRRKTHWAFLPLRIRAVALERDWLTYDQITADHSRIRTRP